MLSCTIEIVSPLSYAARVPLIFKGFSNALFMLEPERSCEEMYPALAKPGLKMEVGVGVHKDFNGSFFALKS